MRVVRSRDDYGIDLRAHFIEHLAEVAILPRLGELLKVAPARRSSTSHSATTFSPSQLPMFHAPWPATPIPAIESFSLGDCAFVSAHCSGSKPQLPRDSPASETSVDWLAYS